MGWDDIADKSARPLFCCCTDHCQLCETLSVIKWGWLILFLIEWDSASIIYIFYAAKHVYSLLSIILLSLLLQAIVYFHYCYFLKYLKPAAVLLWSVWIWEKQGIDESEIVLQNVICTVFNALTVYKCSSSNDALYTTYQYLCHTCWNAVLECIM